MNLAIIPARGGSKRIKHKNIKKFNGKPIIYWTIKAAIKSKLFDRIVVSTDSKVIKKISKKFGAEVPFLRPKKLSGDSAGTVKVVKHAIQWFKKKNILFENVCCIYPTAPFISGRILKKGLKLLNKKKSSYVFTITSFPYSIEKALKVKQNGRITPVWKKNIFKRSQDFKVSYHDAGQMYWGKSDSFLKEKIIFSQKSFPLYLPRYLARDIDTLEDWKEAELLFRGNL